MTKTEKHYMELDSLVSDFLSTGGNSNLIEYLRVNSNLPSRRANLELAKAFILIVEERFESHGQTLWDFINYLINITPEQAPTGNPNEFLAFCGTWALGSIGVLSDALYSESLLCLKRQANDSRWRIREAVAKGIQKILKNKPSDFVKELESWIVKDQYLIMRAVVTGLADPEVLKNSHLAKNALNFHKNVLNMVKNSKNRKTNEFKILRKGLGYSLSVVVQSLPDSGFQYLEELANIPDPDISWILRENLRKNRLVKNFPGEVKRVLGQLS